MPAIGKSEDQLRHVLSPLYMQLFNLIGQLESGVKFLVYLSGPQGRSLSELHIHIMYT